jgi:hypothetical protein
MATSLAVFYLVDLENLGKSLRRLSWSLLNNGDSRPPDHFAIQSATGLSNLSQARFLIILWYINALAEEAGKNMSSSSSEYDSRLTLTSADSFRKFVRLIDQYNKAIPDIISLIEFALKGFKFTSGDAGGPYSAIAALSVLILLLLARLTFAVYHLLLSQLLHHQTGNHRRP